MNPPCDLQGLADKWREGGGKVLVVQTAFLGDVVLVTSLLRALRRVFPKVEVTAVTRPEWAEVVTPWVQRVIGFNKRRDRGYSSRRRVLTAELAAQGFDAAILPHRSLTTGLLARNAGIRVRVGFNRGCGRLVHTHRVPYRRGVYEGERNLDLLRVFGLVEGDGRPEVLWKTEDERFVGKILDRLGIAPRRFVVMAPGSIWKTKRWPVERFRALAQWLWDAHRMSTVAVGGSGDVSLGNQAVLKPELCLAGTLTPVQTAALMSQALFAVCGDTAPTHLATAAKCRQIVIFGSTTPRFGFCPDVERVRPLGLDLWCRPCTDHGRNFCPRFGSLRCLNGLTVDAVKRVCEDWLVT